MLVLSLVNFASLLALQTYLIDLCNGRRKCRRTLGTSRGIEMGTATAPDAHLMRRNSVAGITKSHIFIAGPAKLHEIPADKYVKVRKPATIFVDSQRNRTGIIEARSTTKTCQRCHVGRACWKHRSLGTNHHTASSSCCSSRDGTVLKTLLRRMSCCQRLETNAFGGSQLGSGAGGTWSMLQARCHGIKCFRMRER